MSNLNFYCLIIFDILERPVLIYVHVVENTKICINFFINFYGEQTSKGEFYSSGFGVTTGSFVNYLYEN